MSNIKQNLINNNDNFEISPEVSFRSPHTWGKRGVVSPLHQDELCAHTLRISCQVAPELSMVKEGWLAVELAHHIWPVYGCTSFYFQLGCCEWVWIWQCAKLFRMTIFPTSHFLIFLFYRTTIWPHSSEGLHPKYYALCKIQVTTLLLALNSAYLLMGLPFTETWKAYCSISLTECDLEHIIFI